MLKFKIPALVFLALTLGIASPGYAQSSRIPDLTLDSSPANTDELIVHKSGETRAKKTTRGDLRTSLSGIGACSAGQMVSTLNSDAAPTCSADDDTPDSDSEVPNAITISGGVLLGTNTLSGTLSTSGVIDLDGGTEGTLRIRSDTALPATCTIGDIAWDTNADTDGSLYLCRATNTWKEVDDDGAGGGEANTASNLGGGLANYSTKVSVDLQFNSFAAVDFDLGSNLISIDDTKWSTDAQATTAATTAVNAAGGRSLTCSLGSCEADAELYELSKALVIENPVVGDDFILYRAERALTITGIDCIVVGGTSVSVLVKECDANAGTCGNTEAAITCGLTNSTEASGIDDATIDAGDYLRVDPGTVTGSVTQLFVQVTFLVAD